MKKFLFFFVTFCFFVNSVLFSLEVYGTKENPIKISSYEDLMELSNLVKAGSNFSGDYFVQTNDIVFPDGIEWIPIGDVIRNCAFRGVYNGNGYVIKNIHCEDDFGGFFALLKGTVINLGIESGSIKGKWIGGIASHGNGKIINCYNKAKLISQERAGGIADNFSGKILFSCNFGELAIDPVFEEVAVVYGICSYNANVIEYCYTNFDNLVSPETFKGNLVNSNFGILESEFCNKLNDYYSDIRNIQQGADYSILKIKPYIYKNFKLSFSKESISDIYKSSDDNLKKYFNKYRFNGKGTDEDPYCVSNLDDFTLIRDFVNFGEEYEGIHFLQTKDISFPEENYLPIGNVQNNILFKGIYDGGNHKIFNLHSNNPHAGLFSYLGGAVKNLGIESGEVTGDTVGSIASHGNASAKIINCYNKANLFGYSRAGGIADNFYGEIIDCQNFGNISSNNKNAMLDGICSFKNALVTNCNSSGNIRKESNFFSNVLFLIIAISLLFFATIFLYRKQFFDKKNNCFLYIFSIITIYSLGSLFYGNNLVFYFHQDKQDSFMDLFNSIVEERIDGKNIGIYPPLAIFPYKMFAKIVPWESFNLSQPLRNQAFALRSSIYGTFILLIHIIAFLIPFVFCCLKLLKDSYIKKTIYICSFIFSGIMLYALERGNNIIYALLFSLCFIALYEKDGNIEKQAAYFFLALGASLKFYPAIFGLILLLNKDFKGCFIAFFEFIFVYIVFFFLCNFSLDSNNVAQISSWTSKLTTTWLGTNFSLKNFLLLVNRGISILAKNDSDYFNIPSLIVLLIKLFFFLKELVIFFISKKKWQKYAALSLLCIFMPDVSYQYVLIFLFIPIISFLNDNEDVFSRLYAILFGIMLPMLIIPIHFGNSRYFATVGFVIQFIALFVFDTFIFFHNLYEIIRRKNRA